MRGRLTPGGVLVAVGVLLVVWPALFPVQPVLYHDTGPRTMANGTDMERQGYTVVAYEDLSERGQQLYVATLENGGTYTVPVGEGASEYAYPTVDELGEVEDFRERRAMQRVVVERPPDADLPPADESVEFAEERLRDRREGREERRNRAEEEGETPPTPTTETPSIEEMRQQTARYDLMSTRTDLPPLTAPQSLARLLSVLLGVVAVGAGGYVHSRP